MILYNKSGPVLDLCFSSVGSENHSQDYVFKVGVWANDGMFIARTADYWRLWLNRKRMKFGDLHNAIVWLYARSLRI